jgi:hypothetical protein
MPPDAAQVWRQALSPTWLQARLLTWRHDAQPGARRLAAAHGSHGLLTLDDDKRLAVLDSLTIQSSSSATHPFKKAPRLVDQVERLDSVSDRLSSTVSPTGGPAWRHMTARR